MKSDLKVSLNVIGCKLHFKVDTDADYANNVSFPVGMNSQVCEFFFLHYLQKQYTMKLNI